MLCDVCCDEPRGRPHEAGVGTRKAIAVSHGLGGIFFFNFSSEEYGSVSVNLADIKELI